MKACLPDDFSTVAAVQLQLRKTYCTNNVPSTRATKIRDCCASLVQFGRMVTEKSPLFGDGRGNCIGKLHGFRLGQWPFHDHLNGRKWWLGDQRPKNDRNPKNREVSWETASENVGQLGPIHSNSIRAKCGRHIPQSGRATLHFSGLYELSMIILVFKLVSCTVQISGRNDIWHFSGRIWHNGSGHFSSGYLLFFDQCICNTKDVLGSMWNKLGLYVQWKHHVVLTAKTRGFMVPV